MPHTTWNSLNRRIERCAQCSRLIRHCKETAQVKRRAYRDEDYWGGPVANFGDPAARVLVVGLAPGAHGANRTGRMFTGDRSGDWLYRALHRTGFANQPESHNRHDGLLLHDCAITAVCHCAPPNNKPTRDEMENCRGFLESTAGLLPVRVFVALGLIAWKASLDFALAKGLISGRRPKFSHGAEAIFKDGRVLLGSYHPSQQNTFTGKLTEEMLDAVFLRASELANR